jgi:hypothetical protein
MAARLAGEAAGKTHWLDKNTLSIKNVKSRDLEIHGKRLLGKGLDKEETCVKDERQKLRDENQLTARGFLPFLRKRCANLGWSLVCGLVGFTISGNQMRVVVFEVVNGLAP